jgi:hypothetical protein
MRFEGVSVIVRASKLVRNGKIKVGIGSTGKEVAIIWMMARTWFGALPFEALYSMAMLVDQVDQVGAVACPAGPGRRYGCSAVGLIVMNSPFG